MWVRIGLSALSACAAITSSASARVQATPSALEFGAQQVSTISAPQDVFVTHTPGKHIVVSRVGRNAADFIIERNGCEGDAS